ncbi:hypothetical protein TELCIR_18826 [Teladorsagia circumcincta]|uniref:Uncharacterized protein n=1 Tax=Teladorsagia circumcincta TaxID=45464 RepID=A0A2G9TP05_TELCI|nr:hypothetical protein TELCIR_18826 [Teladorsagia circumcincta]
MAEGYCDGRYAALQYTYIEQTLMTVSLFLMTDPIAWGAHWAVPAAAVGGTDGFSTIHFPTIGTFANIPDDYD